MDYVGKTIIDNIDDMTNIIKTQLNDIAEGFVSVEINADRFKKEYSVDVINGTLRDWEGTLKKVE